MEFALEAGPAVPFQMEKNGRLTVFGTIDREAVSEYNFAAVVRAPWLL